MPRLFREVLCIILLDFCCTTCNCSVPCYHLMYNTVLVELWFIIQSQKREHGPQATQQHQQMCRGLSLDLELLQIYSTPFYNLSPSQRSATENPDLPVSKPLPPDSASPYPPDLPLPSTSEATAISGDSLFVSFCVFFSFSNRLPVPQWCAPGKSPSAVPLNYRGNGRNDHRFQL